MAMALRGDERFFVVGGIENSMPSRLKVLARLKLWRSSHSRIGPLGRPRRGEAKGLVLDCVERQSRVGIQDLRRF